MLVTLIFKMQYYAGLFACSRKKWSRDGKNLEIQFFVLSFYYKFYKFYLFYVFLKVEWCLKWYVSSSVQIR